MPDHLDALNLNQEFLSFSCSGMNHNELILGRPYGGCGILYCKSLMRFIPRLKTNSRRFCAVSINLPDLNSNSNHVILLINVYLPTDYGTSDSNNAFLEAVCELEGFIATQSFDNLVISGDFNVDFSRYTHNCNLLLSFMHKHNLVCADASSGIQYTYLC